LFQGTGWRTKRKPSTAVSILSSQNLEVGSTWMMEPETNLRSEDYPNHPTPECTCCFNSSTNTSISPIDSTMALISSTKNRRQHQKNHVHSPKRKLFSQIKSLVEFTPVSDDEKRIQPSKYLYMPKLQLNHIKPNSRNDIRGRNRSMRVASVAGAYTKSQQSKRITSYDTKLDVVVHNTENSCHGSNICQENASGKSAGSFRKENTPKKVDMLVREGNLLEFEDASEKSTLDSTKLHVNSKTRKNFQELQICLVHCDSSINLCGASSSEFHLNAVPGKGTENALNMPTCCSDSAQEMLDENKVPEEVGRHDIKDTSVEEQTVLDKEGKVEVMSSKGGKEGEIPNGNIHEKGQEVQGKSSRQILQDQSVMEKLSLDRPQDEVTSDEGNIYDVSNSEEVADNHEHRSKGNYKVTQQSTDRLHQDRKMSLHDHEEEANKDQNPAVKTNKEKHVARMENSCDGGGATEFSSKLLLNEEVANMNQRKSIESPKCTRELMNKKCLNELVPHKKSANCILEIKRYSGKELLKNKTLSSSDSEDGSALHRTCTPETTTQIQPASEHMREGFDGTVEKSSCDLDLEDLSDKESLNCDHFTQKVANCPEEQSGNKSTVTKSLFQSNSFGGSEIYSCSSDNLLNDEDNALGGNGQNTLKLNHSADNQNSNRKSSEEADDEGEETENNTSLIHMQPCTEDNDHGNLQVVENNSGKVNVDGNRGDESDIPMPDIQKVYEQDAAQLIFLNSIKEILNDSVHIVADNQFEVLDLPEIISLSAEGNQQESSIGVTENASKETDTTRISSLNSTTTNNIYHDTLFTQLDPTVSNTKVLDLPAEKKSLSTSKNGHTAYKKCSDKELIFPLSVESGNKFAPSQTQATLLSITETEQTMGTRCNSKSVTSSTNNPRKVRESSDKYQSQAAFSSSNSWKSGNNNIFQRHKQNEDCIQVTHSAEEDKLVDSLSQKERATGKQCDTGNTLQQTDETSKIVQFSSSNSSLSSCMERPCELIPKNITSHIDQSSQEQLSFCCPSQELMSPLSSSPPEELGHSQKKGNFLKLCYDTVSFCV
jgi:hypothetical protein